jgi:hypothetical protein
LLESSASATNERPSHSSSSTGEEVAFTTYDLAKQEHAMLVAAKQSSDRARDASLSIKEMSFARRGAPLARSRKGSDHVLPGVGTRD